MRLAVLWLAVPLLLVSVPACSDSKPTNKIATEMKPLPGPPVGAGGAPKVRGKSQIPADKAKVD